jgi:hypothetical protein
MDWLSWLEKKKVQLSIAGWNEEEKSKKKVKFREDDDKGGAWEDSGYAKNASWESWLEKGRWDANFLTDVENRKRSIDTHKKEENERSSQVKRDESKINQGRGRVLTTRKPRFHKGVEQRFEGDNEQEFQDDGSINSLNIEIADSMKSWESWLEKNNATETSHKEGEKKEEWNGKFDNSTTRDDAENDDDKAIGEEESLEELTDGKLEEVEKLKAWEIFLDKTNNATNNFRYYKSRHDKKDKKILDNDGTNYDKSPYHDQEIEASEENRNEETGKLDQDKRNWNTTEGDRGGSKKTPSGETMSYDDSEYDRKTGKYGVTEDGTRNEMRRINQQIKDENTKKPSSPNAVNSTQPPSNLDLHHADTQDVGKTPVGDASTPQTPNAPKTPDKIRKLPLSTESKITTGMEAIKSWELFLEKGITYKEQNVGVHQEQPYAKARTAKQIREAAENVKTEIVLDEDMKKKKSWEGWLEKMQGAGDARYGNQHLTGMEQKPVADDESIDLSAESEENNEKQEKTEDKEDKDNKPYKALSQE